MLEMSTFGFAFGASSWFVYVETVARGDAVALDAVPRLAFSVKKAVVT